MAFMNEGYPVQGSIAQKKIVELSLKENILLIEMLKEVINATYNIQSLTREDFQKNIDEIKRLKLEAEAVKKDFLNYISKTSPSLLYKDEWIRLFFKIRGLADKIVGVAYRLEHILNEGVGVSKDMISLLEKLTDEVLGILESLKAALNYTMVNAVRALKACDEIEAKENKIDELYRKISFSILEEDLSLRNMLILKEAVEMLETIADTIEYASDDLRIILLNMM